MIIDLILDRKDDDEMGNTDFYDPRMFYDNIREYEEIFNFQPCISLAMDYGDEDDVRLALCDYIIKNNYNITLCNYINSVEWL